MAQAPGDGEWTMPAKDYAATRYSRLARITRTPKLWALLWQLLGTSALWPQGRGASPLGRKIFLLLA